MRIARILRIIAGLAMVIALSLGMGIYTHPDFTDIHMVSGLLVAITLLILSIMAIFTNGLRILGVIGIIYAIILPIFGKQQQMILIGDLHWLVQALHVLIGIGAVMFMTVISARFLRLKQAKNQINGQAQTNQL